MSSTSETGHAKNTANFEHLIAFCTGYGATYNPSKAALKLPALNTQLTAAKATIATTITQNTAYNNAVSARLQAFTGIKALSTRLINALQTTDATTEKVKNAKTINRKIQGARASKIVARSLNTAEAGSLGGAEVQAPTTISTSQQSYDQLIQHLAAFIAVLQTETTYTPNETDLKIATLLAKQADLTLKNTQVATAYTTVSNARIARNKALYSPTTGIVNTALEVKQYIKSIYSATSPEYAQVKSIPFKNQK